MIQTVGLSKTYGPTRALIDVSLRIPGGAVCGLLGANGAGKSTLLGILSGALRATSGEFQLGALGTRPTVGSTLERPGFVPALSVRANLEILLAWRPPGDSGDIGRAVRTAQLQHKLEARFETLSMGQQQRTALAAALLTEPELLLLDEPLSGLDVEGAEGLRSAFLRARNRGATILVSSHRVEEVADILDHAVIMHEGQCVAEGPLNQLLGEAYVEVECHDPEASIEHLTRFRDVRLGPSRNTIRVGGGAKGSEIIGCLAGHGLFPDSVVTRRPSLKDAYSRLTH